MSESGPPETLRLIKKGVDEFNSGHFFECHDTLEEVWQGLRGPSRLFFQGLIQISVGFYHLRNGNFPGGRSQLEKGIEKLERYGDRYAGFELEDLRREVQLWLGKVRGGEPLSGLALPKFRYHGKDKGSDNRGPN
jgi:uncharacterized protein